MYIPTTSVFFESVPIMLPAIYPLFSVTPLLSLPISPGHLHTVAPIILLSRHSSNTTTIRKGRSADPWCKPNVTGNPADTPHSVHTLVAVQLFNKSHNWCWGPFLPHRVTSPKCHFSGYSVKLFIQVHKCTLLITRQVARATHHV